MVRFYLRSADYVSFHALSGSGGIWRLLYCLSAVLRRPQKTEDSKKEAIMKQTSLAVWLKLIIIGTGICGVAVYFLILPSLGQSIAGQNPEFLHCYYPWLIFLWITGIPCYAALFLAWKIASNIGADRSFSHENASLLKWIAFLAAGDSLFFFIVNIVYLFLNMNHPGILLSSLIVVFAGTAVSAASAALSHLVKKAASLQEQSDLTI